MKKYSVLLSVFILLACTRGHNKKMITSEVPQVNKTDNKIEQTAVMNTSFQKAVLYQHFSQCRKEGPVIPGLEQNLVPQGMAYWADENLMIISSYASNKSGGVLTFINMNDGALNKILYLNNSDKTPHTGHLGGLAVSRKHLWIASGPGVYPVALEKLKTAEGSILLPALIKTETKASFATCSDNILWVGEFTKEDGSYPVSEEHKSTARDGKLHRGWLAGFKLEASTDMINLENTTAGKVTPHYIISIPDEIQGAAFFDNGMVLSASFGRQNSSRLLLFQNPLGEPPHSSQNVFPGREIALYYLDDTNKTGELRIPPMSEAVVNYKNSIGVLFESAASKYRRTALYPLDRIQFLTPEDILK